MAMDAGLWAHALFLASHLNTQLYQLACKRFVQSMIPEGSPLQTLYLLLAKCPQGGTFSSTPRWININRPAELN